MKMKVLGISSILMLCFNSTTYASHSADFNVDTLLGDGNGTYTGVLDHGGSIHPWFTFNLDAGETATFTLATPTFSSHLFIFDVVDDALQMGDTLGTDYLSVANNHFGTGGSWDFTATATTAGQFGAQIDSYLGGEGGYTFTISGVSEVPIPAAAWLFGSALFGLAGVAKRKKG